MPSRRTLIEAGIGAVGLAGGVAVSQLLLRRSRTPPEGGVTGEPEAPLPLPAGGDDGAEDSLLPDGVEVRTLVLTDGTRMRVLVRGSGPAIVLLHGISLSAEVWFNQLRDLGDAGFRVVAPDLRGHGRSTVGSGGVRLDRVADDIAELLEQLDLDDIVLVGHSMGGMLALRLLTRSMPVSGADARGRVRALGLVATSASPVVGRGVPGARAVIALAGPVLGATGRLASSLLGPSMPDTAVSDPLARVTFGAQPCAEDVRLIRKVSAMVPARIAGALLVQLVSFDAERHLDRVVLPTTVVVGTDDVMTPLRHAETLAGAIADAELVVLPGCGHMVMLERPTELAAAIVALAERAGPARGGRLPPGTEP